MRLAELGNFKEQSCISMKKLISYGFTIIQSTIIGEYESRCKFLTPSCDMHYTDVGLLHPNRLDKDVSFRNEKSRVDLAT